MKGGGSLIFREKDGNSYDYNYSFIVTREQEI